MPVLLFYKRFHEAILDGRKFFTIRTPRRRPIRRGDRLLLRAWEGRPYDSPQRVLLDSVCAMSDEVTIDVIDDRLAADFKEAGPVPPEEMDDFARADGFADAAEMLDYYRATPGRSVPFKGEFIRWYGRPTEERYRPSNGTDLDCFVGEWCELCRHYQGNGAAPCDVLGRVLFHDVEEPEYPSEWAYTERQERICTAFERKKGMTRVAR